MRRRLAVVLILVWAASALAKPPKNDNIAEAKRLFAEGTSAYNLAEYATAIEKYRAAYKLSPSPFLIYNIAQSYRLAKDFDNALTFYDSFLTQLPDAKNRAEVEGFMADLKQQIAARDRAAAEPPKTVVEPSPEPTRIPSPDRLPEPSPSSTAPPVAPASDGKRPIYKKWWFWAGVGAVAVGATVIAVSVSGGDGDPDTHFGRKDLF